MAAYGKLMVVSTLNIYLIEFGLVCFRDNIEQQTTWTLIEFGVCFRDNIEQQTTWTTLLHYKGKLREKTVVAANGECLLWTGSRCCVRAGVVGNYGVICVKCRQLRGGGLRWKLMRVHRLAYMLHHKEWELPPDMHCSHLCHNSLCINVNHLILETPFVNGNRRQCARENICLGHDQAPPCIFF